MNISRPSRNVFYISVIVAILALLQSGGTIGLGVSAFALMAIAYVILLIGVVFKGF